MRRGGERPVAGGEDRGRPDLEGRHRRAALRATARYSLSVYPFSAATAAAGVGIAVLPCIGADSDPRLVRVTDVVNAYDIWLVTSQGVQKNGRVRKIRDALFELLRDLEPELRGIRRPAT